MTRASTWMAGLLLAGAAWTLWRIPPGFAAATGRLVTGIAPAGPLLAVNAVSAGAAVALTTALVLLFDAIGAGLLRWAGRGRPAGPVRLVGVFAGYAAVSLALLGLSAVGLWFPPVLWGVLLVGGLAVCRLWRGTGREWAAVGRDLWRSTAWPARAAWGVVLVWSMPMLLPPEIHVDSLEYHLAFPQQVLLGHRLIGTDAYMAWTSALAADLPNVFPLLAGLDPAAKLLRPLLAVLGGLALLRALGIRSGVSAGIAAAWLACMVTASSASFFTAKNDGIVCGVVLGAMAMALGASYRRGPSRALVLAGGACGLLLSMKVVVAPLAAVVAGTALWRVRARERPRAAGVLALGALAAVLPWLAKSWLFTGDPVYPLGVAWVPWAFAGGGDGGRTAFALARIADGGRSPLAWPGEMVTLAADNAVPALAILPAVVAYGTPGTRLVTVASWVGTGAMVAALRFDLGNVERFAAPAFVMANLVACALILGGRRNAGRRAALLLLAVVAHARTGALALSGPGGGTAVGGWLAGRTSAAEFRRQATGSYGRILPVVNAAIRAARGPGRVLLAGEAVVFGMDARVVGEGLGPRLPWRSAKESGSERRLSIRWRQAGVRWVLHNPWKASWSRFDLEPCAWDSRMLVEYEAFVRGHLRLLRFDGREDAVYGSHWLFEVTRTPAAGVPPRALFLPGAERALSFATRAEREGDMARAIGEFRRLRKLLPGVVALDAALGHALVRARRWEEAYPLVRRSVDAGLVYELNLFDWGITAGHLGRRAEAIEALRRAALACPDRGELLEYARRAAGVSP